MTALQENLARMEKAQEGIMDSIVLIRRLLEEMQANMPKIRVILDNAEKGSRAIPQISSATVEGLDAFREELENVDLVIESLRNNFLIRSNLPPPPAVRNTDAHLRN